MRRRHGKSFRDRRRTKHVVLIGALLLLTACSPRDFLSRRLATDLIEASAEFRSPQRFVLHTGVLSNKDYVSPEFLVLLHRGWISATSAPCPRDLTPPPCWDVVLTPSGVDSVHTLVSPEEAGTSSLTIPAAQRQFISVTGITKQSNSADVEFTWKWVPLNEVGAALYSGDVHYKSSVGFRNYDDGWRLTQGVLHSGQSIDDALKNAEPIP